jgi:hypothetical protein
VKASGRPNWHLMDGAISLIEDARFAGLPVTADVYPYTASSTGLTSIIPERYHEGGPVAPYDRLGDPGVRAAIRAELSSAGRWSRVSEAENVLILRVASEENRQWQGRTLAGRRDPPDERAARRYARPVRPGRPAGGRLRRHRRLRPGGGNRPGDVRRPHRLSAGVSEVLVNGELAGRALAGPGARR